LIRFGQNHLQKHSISYGLLLDEQICGGIITNSSCGSGNMPLLTAVAVTCRYWLRWR